MYLKNFPSVSYYFGSEVTPVSFPNLSVYVDLIDQIKNDITFYQTYTILDGERPDTLSYEFYGTVDYYWVFYLMNDHIRQRGWPLSRKQINQFAKKSHPYTTITTLSDIVSNGLLKVGSVVNGLTSLATATVIDIVPEMGQIVLDTTGSFIEGEIIQRVKLSEDEASMNIVISQIMNEYNAPHHYEDADGNWVDLIQRVYNQDGTSYVSYPPTNLSPSEYTKVSHLEMFLRENEKQKEIVILKPDAIVGVVAEFTKAIKG